MKKFEHLKSKLCCALVAALLAQSAVAQLTMTDIGTVAPAPNSPNDITNIFDGYQLNDGLNYWWDNGRNGNEIGQTFATGSNPEGYTITGMAIKTAGGGGGGELNSQTFVLNFYSIDDSGTATFVVGITNTGKLNKEGNWLQWTGLGVSLLPNTNYAYTLTGGAGYEELSNNGKNPYDGGQICLVQAGGGTVTYGSSGQSDATFDIGLALGTVAGGTVTITDLGVAAPTPGANDIYQLVGDAQDSYGMNYYWDSNPGQTFTTPDNTKPWILNRLAVKWAGGGGGGDLNPQHPIIRIYSVTNGTTATLIYSNAPVDSVALASENGEWFDCTGLSVPLQPNTQYAYTVSRESGSFGWELMATKDGNPYSRGKICLIPVTGGTISYGTQGSGNDSSDAGFIIGLENPAVYALAPTYTPDVANIYAGTTLTLNEAAVGSGTFSYQWQTDNGLGGDYSDVTGGTSSNLVVDTTGLDGYYISYRVIVYTTADGGVSSTSAPVQLNINSASGPFIVTDTTASPDTTVNYEGNTETFSVEMGGTLPISYQWFKASDWSLSDIAPIPGATNSTLTLTNLQLTDTGIYSLHATNALDSYGADSSWVELTVESADQMLVHWQTPVPFDGLTAGEILTNAVTNGYFLEGAYFTAGNSGADIPVVVDGVTNSFSGDGSKVSVSGNSGATTGAYLLGGSNTTGNTNFDNVLDHFAYDGGSHTITLHNLVIGSDYYVQIFALDDRGPGLGRSTSFQDPNSAGDVSDVYGMSENKYLVGTFTAQSTDLAIKQNLLPSGQGNINAVVVGTIGWAPAYPPNFTLQPVSAGLFAGRSTPVKFTATASASPAATYQWQVSTDGGGTFVNLADGTFGDATVSGATSNVLTIANVSLADNGWVFQNTATNSAGSASSDMATLRVTAVPSLSGKASTKVLALHPVAYWPLNETTEPSSGGVGIYDAVGTRDGAYGTASQNAADGILGPQMADGFADFTAGQGALYVGGIDQSWATIPGLNLNTNTVTISMWIYPNGAQPGNAGLLMDRDTSSGGSPGGFCLDGSGANLGYNWNNDSFTWSVAGPAVPSDTWSFVAMVVSPTDVSFYVYNTNSASMNMTTINHAHSNMAWGGTANADPQVRIGCDNSVGRTFNGRIDEVAVFNYSLSSNQVAYVAGVSTNLMSIDPVTANFKASVSGQTLHFTWATDHQGWQLYTNAVGLNANNNWYPVPGSASGTSQDIMVDPKNPNVFFQLRYP